MFQDLGGLFGRKPPAKGTPLKPEPVVRPPFPARPTEPPRQTYTKVFRWRLPDGQSVEPSTVEIVGTFTNWQKVPLVRDGRVDCWHVTLHHIAGNRTHHYMLLVDGVPTYDKHCDGLAIPNGPQEEQYQLPTDKGPRVLMLFGQTK